MAVGIDGAIATELVPTLARERLQTIGVRRLDLRIERELRRFRAGRSKPVAIDPGPVEKRWLARSMGRANRITKRSSHVTVEVEIQE